MRQMFGDSTPTGGESSNSLSEATLTQAPRTLEASTSTSPAPFCQTPSSLGQHTLEETPLRGSSLSPAAAAASTLAVGNNHTAHLATSLSLASTHQHPNWPPPEQIVDTTPALMSPGCQGPAHTLSAAMETGSTGKTASKGAEVNCNKSVSSGPNSRHPGQGHSFGSSRGFSDLVSMCEKCVSSGVLL
ncbi:unnamed protein product [Protopolystoma xenopodis]|uniref:Uncharacterized protein n=1 Tax=Protopolystoma xenopodis TaxID=117903 RepID=A0A448X7C1_9PLAT|nr:unnamed protein product [Protopolystoma xenopodis]